MLLILPGHPHYEPTLRAAPQWWRSLAGNKADPGFCVKRPNGLFEPMTRKEFVEWAHGEAIEEFGSNTDTDHDYLDSPGDSKPNTESEPRVGKLWY